MGRRAGLAAGALVAVVLVVGAAVFAFRTDYQVLFSDLAEGDAAAIAAELDRMKVPYRLDESGSSILVAQDVHKVRMKLMSKELPLKGAVGFELFNNTDFGMTEFAQKVNYQRAMQGELARTIMSIEGVQTARVHLAIPEQGLFKRSAAKPKASIAISMKAGRSLRPDQVAGIQRLVSAAIPDIASQDVTIVGQTGVALTHGAGEEIDLAAASTSLDSKRSVEDYLARKAADMLERTFGQGEAMVSVDATLDLDQSRTTTEDIVPARTDANGATGVIVRQRGSVSAPVVPSTGPEPVRAPSGPVEIDYQVGRRTHLVVSAPGAVKRLNVAVVLKASASATQLDRVKEIVSAAVGIDSKRGDSIAVYSMEQLSSAPRTAVASEPTSPPPVRVPAARRVAVADIEPWAQWGLAGSGVVIALGLLALAWGRRHRVVAETPQGALTAAERDELLKNVEAWMRAPVEPLKAAPR